MLWKTWTLEALGGADWLSVLESWAGIVTAVFVATFAILFNISGTELVLDRDLDTNQELRDAGVLNVVSGALGGSPAITPFPSRRSRRTCAWTRGPRA